LAAGHLFLNEVQRGFHLTAISVIPSVDAIPAILARASSTLDAAKSSAEILEARDTAAFAYDAAKSAARINRAKGAHDDLVQAAHRLQGEALRIDARAKFRLAEEYDAAQERARLRVEGSREMFRMGTLSLPSRTSASPGRTSSRRGKSATQRRGRRASSTRRSALW
jgi:hypothetical protein